MRPCNVCESALEDPVYVSPQGLSITSLTEVRNGRTEVFFCTACGHLQTTPIENLDDYYETQYRILIDSEKEDVLYEVVDDRSIYRVPLQVETLLTKVDLPPGARVLDYGCAKGATARQLAETRPDVNVFLFDVSQMYLPFWERFREPAQWATHEIPDGWPGTFDLVMSFFVMEHVDDPVAVLGQMAGLLQPDGLLYFMVPNVFTNTADFVVADHVSHFSASSLAKLLQRAGLRPVDIDDRFYNGAWSVVASPLAEPEAPAVAPEPSADRVGELVRYWNGLSERIQAFERDHAASGPAAIYGSGFYGTFIASSLEDPDRIECFLDGNPFRQARQLLGKPILAPERLPESIHTVYVGLNPVAARSIVDGIDSWKGRNHAYLYL